MDFKRQTKGALLKFVNYQDVHVHDWEENLKAFFDSILNFIEVLILLDFELAPDCNLFHKVRA